jgi:hypothetical protein
LVANKNKFWWFFFFFFPSLNFSLIAFFWTCASSFN